MSRPTERHRARIRVLLEERLPDIQYLGRAVASRLPAPDPESALVYLRELRDLCTKTLGRLGG